MLGEAGGRPRRRRGVAAAGVPRWVPSAVELDWPGGYVAAALRVDVLLEGTTARWRTRPNRMSELLAWPRRAEPRWSRWCAGNRAAPVRPSCHHPGTVIRATFWVGKLRGQADTGRAGGGGAGRRGSGPPVSSPATSGTRARFPVCLDPRTSRMTRRPLSRGGLRQRRCSCCCSRGRRGWCSPRTRRMLGLVDAYGPVPGAALMRAVKDQFDPGYRMFPGRLARAQLMHDADHLRSVAKDCVRCGSSCPAKPARPTSCGPRKMDSPCGAGST